MSDKHSVRFARRSDYFTFFWPGFCMSQSEKRRKKCFDELPQMFRMFPCTVFLVLSCMCHGSVGTTTGIWSLLKNLAYGSGNSGPAMSERETCFFIWQGLLYSDGRISTVEMKPFTWFCVSPKQSLRKNNSGIIGTTKKKTFIFQEFSIISQSRSVQISTKIAAGLRIRVGVDGFLDTRKLTRNSE